MMETAPELSGGLAAGLIASYAIILVAGLGSLICGIMVGVKILQKEGTGLGVLAIILAIFCGIATFVWGWVKVKDYAIKKLMTWYTVSIVGVILGYVVMLGAGAGAMASMSGEFGAEMQRAMEEAAAEAAAIESGDAGE